MSSTVEHVYRSHAGVVRHALRSFGVDAAALDDAVQDVFVVLVRRMDDFDPHGSWTNWLWGIARRVARGYRRGAGRRERLHAVLPRATICSTPEDELARARALAFLEQFLGELSPALLETFVLVEIEGRTGPEVAAASGVNLNTVYARIRAVRRRFDDAIDSALAPARTGAWGWFGLASLWAPVATTAAVVFAVGFADPVAPHVEPVLAVVESSAPPPAASVPTSARVAADELEDEIVIELDPDVPPQTQRPKRSRRVRARASIETESEPLPRVLAPDGEHVIVHRPQPQPIRMRPKSSFVPELRVLVPAG